MSYKFAQSTSLLQTIDLIFYGDLEKVAEKNAEFENSDNFKKLRKSQCLCSKYFSANDLIFFGDVEKVDEKNAEFENCNNLNKGNKSQC